VAEDAVYGLPAGSTVIWVGGDGRVAGRPQDQDVFSPAVMALTEAGLVCFW
jgi:hypothetical protein